MRKYQKSFYWGLGFRVRGLGFGAERLQTGDGKQKSED